MRTDDEPLVKPGSAADIALASLLLLALFGIVIGVFLFAAFNYDPSAPKGPLPWSW